MCKFPVLLIMDKTLNVPYTIFVNSPCDKGILLELWKTECHYLLTL